MLITENWQTQFSFPKIGSNFWTTWFGLITTHWKTIKLLLSNMCLITSHVIFFQQFLIDFRKNIYHEALSNSIQPYLMFLVYLLATNGSSVCRSLKKLKNEGSTMFRGSVVRKLQEKCFSVKIWITIKKICLHQQKMNGNDTIIFLILWKNYSIAFKWGVMISETIHSSVYTNKTVTTKILNKNQWCHHRTVLK